MKYKKQRFFLAASVFAFSLAGCGNGPTPASSSESSSSSTKDLITITVENGTGGGVYEFGETATITATVPEHASFKSWLSDGVFLSDQNPYSFVCLASHTYTATFEYEPVQLTVVGAEGSGVYKYGETVTLKPSTTEWKGFGSWKMNGEIVSTKSDYSFTITGDMTIECVYDYSVVSPYVKTIEIDEDKEFKILSLTDIQLHDGENLDDALSIIDELAEKENPDMVVFLGDLLNDDPTYPSIVNSTAIIDKIDSLGVPWAPIFGNHDYDDYSAGYPSAKTRTAEELAELYLNASNSLFTRSPESLPGKGNYAVNLVSKTTKKPVRSLVFLDSRLSGLEDSQVPFYESLIRYGNQLAGEEIPSNLFTHIALNQYGDAYEAATQCEYKNVVGSINRNPCDLAAGTKLLFPKIKELRSTKTVLCGHDHENNYYTYHDGVRLAYSMKSSMGDKYENPARLGGTTLTFKGEEEELNYTTVSRDIVIDKAQTLELEELPYWQYSGAKLEFDVEMPNSGRITLSICGTNMVRKSLKPSERYGQWNRLAEYIYLYGSSKSASMGTLTPVSGNKYHYCLDLASARVNNGEDAYGDETARLYYFSDAQATFTISDFHLSYETVTEKDQLDLADAQVGEIVESFYNDGYPVKPTPNVTLGGVTLKKVTDILYTYENNIEEGEATLRIVPSGKGAHKYKGEKIVKFDVTRNPDEDEQPGHERAQIIENDGAIAESTFGNISLNDWYNSGKSLHFDLKPLQYGKVRTGKTIKFALHGGNTNPGAPLPGNQFWNRLSENYILDFSNDTVSVHTDESSDNIAIVEDIGDGWFSVDMPLNKFQLNSEEGACGNDKETLSLCYFFGLTRSFKIDKISLI